MQFRVRFSVSLITEWKSGEDYGEIQKFLRDVDECCHRFSFHSTVFRCLATRNSGSDCKFLDRVSPFDFEFRPREPCDSGFASRLNLLLNGNEARITADYCPGPLHSFLESEESLHPVEGIGHGILPGYGHLRGRVGDPGRRRKRVGWWLQRVTVKEPSRAFHNSRPPSTANPIAPWLRPEAEKQVRPG